MLIYERCCLLNSRPFRVNWHQEEHWEGIVFSSQDRWVVVEVVPLDWWNRHMFKVIGEKLGGLIEVAFKTVTLGFTCFAKLRVRGPPNGFLPAVLELPRGLIM